MAIAEHTATNLAERHERDRQAHTKRSYWNLMRFTAASTLGMPRRHAHETIVIAMPRASALADAAVNLADLSPHHENVRVQRHARRRDQQLEVDSVLLHVTAAVRITWRRASRHAVQTSATAGCSG